MPELTSATGHIHPPKATFGERLRFVVWLGELRLGTRTQQDFADAVGKTAGQISSWLKETPRPDFSSIQPVAEQVGVSALWLYDPASVDARVPELWNEWIASAVRWAEAHPKPTAKLNAKQKAGVATPDVEVDARAFVARTAKEKAAKGAAGTRGKRAG